MIGIGLSLTRRKRRSDITQQFVDAVQADGGFVANEAHAKTVIDTFINASLACPMVAGDDGKLYFRSN